MAAGVTIKHKRKAGDFASADLVAGELGVNTTDKSLNFSTNGTDVLWTEKRSTTASSGTPTPTGDGKWNFFTVTALAATGAFAAPSGTPADGNTLIIRIKDNGTLRSLSWDGIYRAVGVTLPTVTVANKTLYVGAIYNSASSTWDVIASVIQA